MTRYVRTSRYQARRVAWLGNIDTQRLLIRKHDDSGPSIPAWRRNGNRDGHSGWREKLLEGSATALGSVLVLGLVGYSYHRYYKSLVLRKMENAFAAGYSTLELAALGRQLTQDSANGITACLEVTRPEQEFIDSIINGSVQGHYHLLTGEKGTGKTSMLLKAMRKIEGEGVVMLEAHPDLEIFRLRLGKALNYEFHEDYIGSLFSFRGPRDTTPLLDIERAFNKMEKIALKRREKVGRPLVLVINRAHLFGDDDDGRHLLEAIQQRAEMWAASNLVTVVLNSNEFWIGERLMPEATRLRVLPIHDIPKGPTITALRDFRNRSFGEDVSEHTLERIYAKIGGRFRFLSQVAKAPDMDEACRVIYEKEKKWFLSQCWIFGGDIDDDAESQQEFCAAAMVLAKALVDEEATKKEQNLQDDHALPSIPLHKARQIMTRADLIQHHDRINIFTIDSNSMVQADSVVMQDVFRELCAEDGFEEHLDATLERLDELEDLRRTRVLALKDVDGNKGYQVIVKKRGQIEESMQMSFKAIPPEEEGS
ncbi:hypothetical protein NW759_006024 [Fusarium solani]|nr:hypothetical protein NW759_006024 [Fusarium solani]